jgi:GNAT superfamily N-acetyltransferase
MYDGLMIIRPFTEADISWALERIDAEGWTPSRPVLEAIVAHDPDGCFVAEVDGAPAGMVTSTRYAATAWVGHLVVLPGLRRHGIGSSLIEHALEHLRRAGARTVRIEADTPGLSIYRRLGFREEIESLRFRLVDPPSPTSTQEPILELEIEEAAVLDTPVFGDERRRLLGLLHEKTTCAYMIRKDDRVQGYVMALPTERGISIGPLVARTPRAAWDLLAATLVSDEPTTYTIGIPAPCARAAGIVGDIGFEPRPPSLRMVLGDPGPPGDPACIYAIASGATG